MERAKSTTAKVLSGKVIGSGVGRRKSAVARVWLRRGTGKVMVNGKDHTSYFDTSITRSDAVKSLKCVPSAQYDIVANVNGGGTYAQAGAVRLGIARAIVGFDESTRAVLRQEGFLTCDSRVKERKKPGQPAARRKFQFVKR
jgi:small subunit ribosomal protein S9